MPIPIISTLLYSGFDSIPHGGLLLKTAITLATITLLKLYFSGPSNPSSRLLHSKVVLITGGTSGVGAAVAHALALQGAQLVLLTQHPLSDPFLQGYIVDLRAATANEMITAETVDLADLMSIRRFATKWVDNAPPRRLDMLVLCADERTPASGGGTSALPVTEDGVEKMWAINYLANFHLLGILSPALRAQPPDRDVRVIIGMCGSYMGGDVSELLSSYSSSSPSSQIPSSSSKFESNPSKKASTTAKSTAASPIITQPSTSPSASKAYATSKLALLTFSSSLQKHLSGYKRPDGLPANARVVCVDPGFSRTPGTRRLLSRGSLWGLLLYVVMYPLWWLVLKSPVQGAQSFLWVGMDAFFGRGEWSDAVLVKECRLVKRLRSEVVEDESVQKALWQASENMIERVEREAAVRRASEKKDEEKDGENTKATAKEKKPGSRRSKRVEEAKN